MLGPGLVPGPGLEAWGIRGPVSPGAEETVRKGVVFVKKSERINVTLPPETAAKLRAEAARRHVSVSSLVALAVERLTADLEAKEHARRAEVFARAALLAALEGLGPESRQEKARELVAEAAKQVKRMEEKR